MTRSPGFGSIPYNYFALFILAFASPTSIDLSSLYRITRWPIMQKVRRHLLMRLRLIVGTRFQIYFTPTSGFFSPFPHGTCPLSVINLYLGLESGLPIFGLGFSGPALLESRNSLLPLQDYHLLRSTFPDNSGFSLLNMASSAFARHYLRSLFDFLSSRYLDVSVP